LKDPVDKYRKIRLLIVDDHYIVRQGLRSFFANHRDVEVVAEAADLESAVARCSEQECDVALVDLRLRNDSGVDVIRALAEVRSSCRCVVVTSYGSEEEVHTAIAAGAKGYVFKHSDPSEIINAVRAVHAGLRYLSAEASEVLNQYVEYTHLTERERDVLRLLVPGTRNKAIAKILGIGEETVKAHVKSILDKLGVQDRTEAATQAIQRGLVRFDD
jgi:DNA-binding NarL/FixJ family response regulator